MIPRGRRQVKAAMITLRDGGVRCRGGVVAGMIPAALMFAEAPQRDGTHSQAAPAEPSHPASVQRRARRGGEKQQIDDDPVPF